MIGGAMDFQRSMDNLHRGTSFRSIHSEDRFNNGFSGLVDKSQSLSTLPTKHSKYGFSYLPSSTSSPVRDERPPSRGSETITSRYSERPSSRHSDRYSSHFDDRASSRYSDHGSTRTSDSSPQHDRYVSRNSGRSSSLSRDSMPTFDREYSSYEKTSSSLYDNSAPSIHDRVTQSLDRALSPREESGISSGSYHRDDRITRSSYDSGRSFKDESNGGSSKDESSGRYLRDESNGRSYRDESSRFQNSSSSGYGNGLLDNHHDHSSSDTLTGSGKYNTISSSKHDYHSGKSSLYSGNLQNGYSTLGSGKTQRISDLGYKGSKSYSTLPRSFDSTGDDYYKRTLKKSTYNSSRDDGRSSPVLNGTLPKSSDSNGDDYYKRSFKRTTSYDSAKNGRSSPLVNGGSSYTSDTGQDRGEKHTGWFRNHQYGPLLSREADLGDLREDAGLLRSVSRDRHYAEESHMSHPDTLRRDSRMSHGSMLSKSSIQLDDRRNYRDQSVERESQDVHDLWSKRKEENSGLLVRSLSQDQDLGYHSMRKEVPFHPPERLERGLSETRPYHSMTNLDSTMTSSSRKSRSRTRRYQRNHGLNAGKELGVKPTLSATDLSQPDVNELGVMAYSAGYHKAKSSTRTKSETPKPAKVDWGRCARFSLDEIVGAQYSQEVATNTKGLVAHKGVINEVIVVKIRIVSDRAIATDISAQVDAPGESVPISLKKISDDLVEASVLPLNEGIHTINIRCRNELIEGCPIRIMVMRDDSSFPENVKVGKITTAVVGEELQFQVDVAEAGKGELTVTISNGLHELPVRLEQNGAMFTIFTIADAVGDYNVNILWDRNPVTDEPAKLRVYDPNRVTVSGEGLTRGREGTPAKFIVDPRNAGFAELKVSVEGPNSMAKVTVSRNEDKTYTVTYVPTEVGFFNINVQYGGRPIYGAPFRAKITDPRKVRFSGLPALRNDDGSIDLHLRENYRIVLETDEAGPGDLHAEMETVNAILPLQVDSMSSHRHSVLFAPPKEGKCVIRVRWSGSDIKGSPFVGYARQKETPIDHTKVKVHGEGIQSSKVYIPSEFVIDGSQAGAGKPSVNITGSSKDVNVKIESMKNMENMYKVSYMAEKAGTYIVYVAWSDKQIPDSPFRVAVEANPHAERVRASAMKGLVAHQTCKVLIDTRDAADGDLTAKCMGPTKPAEVSIGRNEEGLYQLFITPKEPGLHRLDVLYGEQHIQGSPFDLRVSAPPDAKKVRARGPGLNHGIIDTYNGRFICETRGAGAGQLKVRVHGPKGAFKVEMMRSSKKDRTIDVRYNPTEVGEYKVEVKWSDDQVPGSPFVVTVVDTPEELRHVRRENPIDPKYTTLTQGEWVEDL